MMAPAMSLLARMDRLPFSRPHYALLVIGGLGYAFDGADNALVAFLLPSMAREWDLDNGALGLLAAAGPVGYLVGALVAGTLGDRIGRRPIMMWALAIYTVCTMVAALAPTYEVFAAARILAGVGIGAESVIVAPYLSEFVPPSRRGWFVGCLAGFFSFGYVAAALLWPVRRPGYGRRLAMGAGRHGGPDRAAVVVAPVAARVAPVPSCPRAPGGGRTCGDRVRGQGPAGDGSGAATGERERVGRGRRRDEGRADGEPGVPLGTEYASAHGRRLADLVRQRLRVLRLLHLDPDACSSSRGSR